MIETENKLAISWLKNGIWALALAGFYSIVLVILRTPQLSQIISDKSVFKSSLVKVTCDNNLYSVYRLANLINFLSFSHLFC